MRREFTPAEAETKFDEMWMAAAGDATLRTWITYAAQDEGATIHDFTGSTQVTYAVEHLIRKGVDLASIIRRHH